MTANGQQPFAYERLMPFQVRDILVVASAYDNFLFEEEGKFSDRLLTRYRELDLSSAPQIDHVTSGREALNQLRRRSYDLVVATPHIDDVTPAELGEEINRRHEGLPVVLLTFDRSDPEFLPREKPFVGVDRVFLWTGDPRLFLAVVKGVEDAKNAPHDTAAGSVRVILLVEDSPAFYSAYLPILYSELLEQVASLLADRLNERERHYRMRARPKILLARTWGEGKALLRRYQNYLLGLVCDVRFPRGGRLDASAGLDFIEEVREAIPDLPVLLQSSEPEHAELARELGASFADKNSRELLGELRTFMRDNFGFGPFVFRNPRGEEVTRAEGIRQMVEVLATVPGESLIYHAERNHFSIWLMARSEFELARDLRPRKATDFRDAEEMRRFLIEVLSDFVEERQRGQVAEFARTAQRDFTRIGSGSMGGKGRGLAFVARLLAGHPLSERFRRVKIGVPRAAVICTDVFDRFCRRDGLWERALACDDDAEVARMFLAQSLDDELLGDLAVLLEEARYPLAVRSSSLLEDSEFQPLAGLYKTFLLPNSSPSDSVRLEQLSRAVRLIYASTFFRGPRTYMEATSQRIEEEKMAVVIQRLVGRRHDGRFYPDFAGVAQSHNYYPLRWLEPEDGIAAVALGLGETVVSGDRAFRFSPAHPELALQMATPEQALRTSQRRFYALDLGDSEAEIGSDESATLVRLGLEAAEQDGTLAAVGATYSPDNDAIYDSIYRRGVRLVNFAGVLKHRRFPLAPLLTELLAIGREGMGTPVEMEFAALVRADGDGDAPAEMSVLQLRPLVAEGRTVEVDLEGRGRPRLIAGPALGNGVIEGVRDVVYLHPDRLGDLGESAMLAQQIGRINVRLARDHRPYLLMGPGRWGTADPWLGIPVEWKDVSGARVIVELIPEGSPIESSQGTHFFHNITSLRIGYFCVGLGREEEKVDLDWLESLEAEQEAGPIRHVMTPQPLEVRIDGRKGWGVVLR